jgi:MFS family permease
MTGSSTKQAGAPRWSALQRWTLGVTSMAAFMAGMDALVVTAALPTIHANLGAATSALSWTVVAYALGFAAVVLAASRSATASGGGGSSSPGWPCSPSARLVAPSARTSAC